jgi:hypothetical protein
MWLGRARPWYLITGATDFQEFGDEGLGRFQQPRRLGRGFRDFNDLFANSSAGIGMTCGPMCMRLGTGKWAARLEPDQGGPTWAWEEGWRARAWREPPRTRAHT